MPKNRLSAHDRFIKSVFTNPKVVREFFEANLPDNLKAVIDFNSIEPQKDLFVTDKLRLQLSDLLFSAKINNKDSYLYCLLEHASTSDRLLSFRMLKYMTAIIENHLKKTGETKFPIIYPMILHTGPKPYAYSTDFFDLFEENKDLAKEIFSHPYKLIDLSRASDEELKKYFWFGAAALIAKHIKDPDILPTLKVAIELFRKIENQGEKEYSEDYIYVTLSYIVEAAEIRDKEEFIETIKKGLTQLDEDKIMTLAEQWKQEGRQEGLQEGRQEGLQEGLEKGRLEVARSMLQKGLNPQIIMEMTGLSEENLSQLLN